MSVEPAVIFGKPEEWQDFHRRHPRFAKRLPRLRSTLEVAFEPVRAPRLVDRVVRHLLRTCVEDFFEILLLAGNGYGIGAQKLLRGMYERAVTAHYLSKHPSEVRAFYYFHRINMYKLIGPLEKVHDRKDIVPPRIKAELTRFYKRFKKRVITTTSGKRRPRSTRSWLDDRAFQTIADQCAPLDRIYPYGWLMPTYQDHATAANILARVEQDAQGGVAFIDGPHRDVADGQLTWAHLILCDVVETQVRHFRRFRKTKRALQEMNHDFLDIWHGHCPGTAG